MCARVYISWYFCVDRKIKAMATNNLEHGVLETWSREGESKVGKNRGWQQKRALNQLHSGGIEEAYKGISASNRSTEAAS